MIKLLTINNLRIIQVPYLSIASKYAVIITINSYFHLRTVSNLNKIFKMLEICFNDIKSYSSS